MVFGGGCGVEIIEHDGTEDCGPDCVPAGAQLECVELLEGSIHNDVLDLLPSADEGWLAAGAVETESQTHGWVARFDAAGQQQWFTQVTLPEPGDVEVVDLAPALASNGGDAVWALAVSSTMDYLVQLDRDGAIASTVDLDTEAGFHVSARAIESTSAGVWIAGTSQADMWLALYDPATAAVTTLLLEDHLGFNDEILAITAVETGVAIAATVSTSPNFDGDSLLTATTDILVIHFDLQGSERSRTLLRASSEPTFARRAMSISADPQGRWFVGGVQVPLVPGAEAQLWLARVGADEAWEWTSEAVLDSVGFAGILAFDDGVLTAGGQLVPDGANTPSVHPWLGSVADGGALRWQHVSEASDYEHDEYKVLMRDAQGRVHAASKAWGGNGSSLLRSCRISQ
ncbi:hypothetical protein DB30_04936 [Enhygromyxa salina]|uniref:Uncharacterized protein n=1 Tax=Enhygromyxa salina TaxID=215803 RepID=A0A0C1ZEG5_9BACT|nr:hypothetical protein DB30_04936 [Enhygromyxa salina]